MIIKSGNFVNISNLLLTSRFNANNSIQTINLLYEKKENIMSIE
jgi:hypothetical protein